MEKFELPVGLRIKGPVEKIFEAWLEPQIASQWLCDRMEGSWKADESIFWIFEKHRQELKVIEVVPNKYLKFRWNAGGDRPETVVQINFHQLGAETALGLLEKSGL